MRTVLNSSKHTELANHAWSVADLLRGDYKQSEYGKVILPFTVLRRLECVLAPTKDKVLETYERFRDSERRHPEVPAPASRHSFYNVSGFTLKAIAGDPAHVAKNLLSYIGAFSPNAQEVMERYDFANQIKRLDNANLLYQVVGRFADLDLHPEVVSNHQMGYVFEELIRRFAEQSNETAGEHFTPREVIELMVNLLFAPDDDALTVPGVVRDGAGPGVRHGRHAVARPRSTSPRSTRTPRVQVFGQELNPESWAICRSDMMIKGQDAGEHHVRQLASPTTGTATAQFDYLLANPPFGVEWKKVKDDVERRARHARLRRPLRRRPAADQRRLAALPPAHALEDAAGGRRQGRQPHRDRLQRLAALHRRGRVRRVATSAAGSSRTTGWRRSSPCPTSSSTTPASRPTSGS